MNKGRHTIKEITIADNTQGNPNTNNLADLPDRPEKSLESV